ncbi:hypothetical protein RFI_20202 [Reticulomyxa filosa]|uniref:16S rRNA (uracil(1498)-N(3))-methyltransferase n=1 Tax=Reticulomyxa filosa TaxID=46433 RepID=X6MTX5_RETFI|nr:hypothetical protein RFI_20202 [Reticulomyxa filosa]|eukprot:ETO17131.1 hypothetical protein RFI_20202 [Reticulomyxa filosa]
MTENLGKKSILKALSSLWTVEDLEMNLILFTEEEIEAENKSEEGSIIRLKADDYRAKHIGTILECKSGKKKIMVYQKLCDVVRIGIINGKQGSAVVEWSDKSFNAEDTEMREKGDNSTINDNDNNNNNNNNDNVKTNSANNRISKKKKRSNLKCDLTLKIISDSMKLIPDTTGARIILLLAIPRPKQLNRLFPIISSIGIHQLILINCNKTEKCYFDTKYLESDRVLKGFLSGLSQCRDTVLPLLSVQKQNLQDFLKHQTMFDLQNCVSILAHPGQDLPRLSQLPCFQSTSSDKYRNKNFVLAIGPEGGWIPEEISLFESCGFNLCSLGPRVLRTDVACISLLSVLRECIHHTVFGCSN